MTIAKHYVMTSIDACADDLKDALLNLAAKVRIIGCCEGVTLFQDMVTPTRFTFIEYWTSVNAHREGGRLLGKDVLAPVVVTLAAPPEGTNLQKISS